MARPAPNAAIAQGSALFATETNQEFDVIRQAPFPPVAYPLLTNFPVPGLYEGCIAFAEDTGLLYISINNVWAPIAVAMVTQADSVAVDHAALLVDFNLLLDKLRTASHL